MPKCHSEVQKAAIVELFITKKESYALFCVAWRNRNGKHDVPPHSRTIKDILKNFREAGRLTST